MAAAGISLRGPKERAGRTSRPVEKEDGGRDARGPPSGPQGRTRLFLPPPPLKADQAPSSHCQHRAPSAKRSMVVLHLLSTWDRAGTESRAWGETAQYIASCPIFFRRRNDDRDRGIWASSLTACSSAPSACREGRRSLCFPAKRARRGPSNPLARGAFPGPRRCRVRAASRSSPPGRRASRR